MTAADIGTVVSIGLSHNAEASIEAAAGGLWALGGAVMTLDGNPLHVVFGYANDSMPRRLVLELEGPISLVGFETGNTTNWSVTIP